MPYPYGICNQIHGKRKKTLKVVFKKRASTSLPRHTCKSLAGIPNTATAKRLKREHELKKTYVRSKPYEMNPPVQSTGVCLANPPHIVAFQALDYRIVPEIRATEKNVN